MDSVTLIVAALAAGAVAGLKDTATQAGKDAYAGLKTLALNRVKDKSAGELAVTEHQKDPDTWSVPLAKILTTAGAGHDEELIAAAQRLMGHQRRQLRSTSDQGSLGLGDALSMHRLLEVR